MALTLSTTFFVLSNLAVAPFYLLMLVAPQAGLTRRVISSLWPIAVPVVVYVSFVFAILAVTRPDVLGLWRALYVENGLASGGAVTWLSQVYGAHPEFAVLHGWVHLVVGDLFMARWAYLDANEHNLAGWVTALTAVLIGFLGPIGVLVYLGLRRAGRSAAT